MVFYFKNERDKPAICSLEIPQISRDNKIILKGRIRKTFLMRLKDVYMSFLEHMNEDFDDDLLLDCISML